MIVVFEGLKKTLYFPQNPQAKNGFQKVIKGTSTLSLKI